MKIPKVRMFTLSTLVALIVALAITAVAGNAPRITKEELRALLGNPDLIVADVRIGKDWRSSKYKIKGAVQVNPEKVDSWAKKYGKDTTIVFYCA